MSGKQEEGFVFFDVVFGKKGGDASLVRGNKSGVACVGLDPSEFAWKVGSEKAGDASRGRVAKLGEEGEDDPLTGSADLSE